MTTARRANEVRTMVIGWLRARGISISRVSARTVRFTDLARASATFVRVEGWSAGPAAWDDLKAFAKTNGFFVE